MTKRYPEFGGRSLVLWCVRRGPDEQLVCQVSEVGGLLTLSVLRGGPREVRGGECLPDPASLIRRADAIRQALVASGWVEADPLLERHRG